MKSALSLPKRFVSWTTFLVAGLAPVFLFAETTFSDGQVALGDVAALPKISVEGNRFVDPDGETVILRGVATVDPAELERRGQWDRSYFEAAASWNANVVRVAVHPLWWRQMGKDWYLQALDDAVRWSGELGMYVIIDWHTIGNPLTEVFHRDIYETSRGETFRFWYTIAQRYAGNSTVACYELWNEPTNRGGKMGRLPWSEYKEYIEELISMIRAIDETSIPLVAGFNWGYDLSMAKNDPIDFPGVAYVSHPYPQKRPAPWIEHWERDWGFMADRFPMVCTEFGFMSEDGPGAHVPVIGDEVYGEALIGYFEEKGISWTAWVFDYRWSPQLYSDEDYTPTRQGAFFKKKMEELNR
ncbi:cellulase family glycosylhydrolase [Pelagicoccus sp. NFK12]|uniref:Cellulase family glycosylhydrolase n=1 Tax=Pelagicoccus enzymogenes TaxID=2773457 RepID=A0A927FA11_9BACT|nr:cellulase family glycosylhydrolase [Pelagicoccus enzymogenes]MBD5781117.1 cellulase family glycosylhydrolase [Pelagicoccus enzymogenes]